MDEPVVVGRDAELATLEATLTRAAAGTGRVVLIEGPAGGGKRTLLELVERRAQAGATDDDDVSLFLHGDCELHGSSLPYAPFHDSFKNLRRAPERSARRRDQAWQLFKRAAPHWVEVAVGLSTPIKAGAETVKSFFDHEVSHDAGATRTEQIAEEYVEALREMCGEMPVVVAIHDAHWIDPSSCKLVMRLARAVRTMRAVVILTYRPAEIGDDHPLARLQLELVAAHDAQVLRLANLTAADIATYVERRFGDRLHPRLAAWLHEFCGGQPLFIQEYLSWMASTGLVTTDGGARFTGDIRKVDGRWQLGGQPVGDTVPARLQALLTLQLTRLTSEERALLRDGAVQGPLFLTNVLATLVDRDQDAVVDTLDRLAERHHIIEFDDRGGWFEDRSDAFRFENDLLHETFYAKLRPRRVRELHRKVAEVLEAAVGDFPQPPRRLLLDIAHNYARAGDARREAAYLYAVAEQCFFEGAFTEAGTLSRRAFARFGTLLGAPRPPALSDAERRTFVDCTVLMLLCASFGSADDTLEVALDRSAPALDVARGLDDQTAAAELLAIRGVLLIHCGRTDDAIAELERALDAARATGDRTLVARTMMHLGFQLAKRDLDASLAMREAALALYDQDAKEGGPATPAVQRHVARMRMILGVGLFDAGRFGEALDTLTDAWARLRALGLHQDLHEASNYLAQLQVALGAYDDVETTLGPSVARSKRDRPHPWIGCNLGLLGKARLDAGRVADAAAPLAEGLRQSEATEFQDLVNMVRNWYAEWLIHPDNPDADHARAETLLRRNVELSEPAGLERSVVVARTLLARLALARGDVGAARAESGRAAARLDAAGAMPAVRSEEVWLVHAEVLDAAGDADGSRTYLKQAYDTLAAKAATLGNADRRRRFLEQVTVSRTVADRARALGWPVGL